MLGTSEITFDIKATHYNRVQIKFDLIQKGRWTNVLMLFMQTSNPNIEM